MCCDKYVMGLSGSSGQGFPIPYIITPPWSIKWSARNFRISFESFAFKPLIDYGNIANHALKSGIASSAIDGACACASAHPFILTLAHGAPQPVALAVDPQCHHPPTRITTASLPELFRHRVCYFCFQQGLDLLTALVKLIGLDLRRVNDAVCQRGDEILPIFIEIW